MQQDWPPVPHGSGFPGMESVLSLTKNIAKWLTDEGEIVPVELTRRRGRRK